MRAVMPTEQMDAMITERDSRRRARASGADLGLRELAAALSDPQRPLSIRVTQGDATLTLTGKRTSAT